MAAILEYTRILKDLTHTLFGMCISYDCTELKKKTTNKFARSCVTNRQADEMPRVLGQRLLIVSNDSIPCSSGS